MRNSKEYIFIQDQKAVSLQVIRLLYQDIRYSLGPSTNQRLHAQVLAASNSRFSPSLDSYRENIPTRKASGNIALPFSNLRRVDSSTTIFHFSASRTQ